MRCMDCMILVPFWSPGRSSDSRLCLRTSKYPQLGPDLVVDRVGSLDLGLYGYDKAVSNLRVCLLKGHSILHTLDVNGQAFSVTECHRFVTLDDLVLAASTFNGVVVGFRSPATRDLLVHGAEEHLSCAVLRQVATGGCHRRERHRYPMPSCGSTKRRRQRHRVCVTFLPSNKPSTSGLDPLVQREFLAMVREARNAGQTVLLSSHVLSEIQQSADDVAVLAAGKIVAEGPVSSLRLASVRRVRATLAGSTADVVRAALASVAGLDEIDITDAGDLVRVSATARGEIDPVIRALAHARIRDLTVEEPDLEESVLALYSRAERAS